MKTQLLIACDFDGTVTRQDTLVEILDLYGSARWREIQNEVVSGKLSIREGLQAEMGAVRANLEQIKDLLANRVELEPSFQPFLRKMRGLGIPLILLSGGFDLCVEAVLTNAGLWPLPFLANRLRRHNGCWAVEFPYPSPNCSACGHCKGDPIRGWNQQGFTTIFVGNGVTDHCAAQQAKLTFAKEELLSWCQTQAIPAVSFRTFDDVDGELIQRGWL